jgi:hypothetical protein
MYLLKMYTIQKARKIQSVQARNQQIMQSWAKKNGVVGAVMDDAEQEQGGVVSPTLTSFMLYEFVFCLNSFIVCICI